MNLTTFFAYARRAPFGGRLTQAQIDGMTAILAEWDERKILDNRWLAYMLATAFHETGGKMQPLRENMNYTSAAQIKKTWPTRFPSEASAQPFVRNWRALANKIYSGRLGNTGPDTGGPIVAMDFHSRRGRITSRNQCAARYESGHCGARHVRRHD